MFFSRKKNIFLLLSLVIILAGIVSFSPYTITRLITRADEVADVLNDNPEYVRLQNELDQTTQEEQETLAQVAAIDEKMSQKEIAAASAPAFDEAVAPATVTLKIEDAETKKAPKIPVTVMFVGVGDKKYDASLDKDGSVFLELTSGRYYTEIELNDPDYVVVGDGPAFFANANEEKDLGVVYITKK